jgi:hypothetical protein
MSQRTTRTNPAPRTTRVARLEARITREALAIVRRATQIQGRSVSDFVVAAAQEAAARLFSVYPQRWPGSYRNREAPNLVEDSRRNPLKITGKPPRALEANPAKCAREWYDIQPCSPNPLCSPYW